jgi:hypothetical protein
LIEFREGKFAETSEQKGVVRGTANSLNRRRTLSGSGEGM